MEINVTIFDIINLFFCYSDVHVHIFNNYKIVFFIIGFHERVHIFQRKIISLSS